MRSPNRPSAVLRARSRSTRVPGQDVIGTPSPMNQGASVGAWDIGWTTSEDGWIDGHNDFLAGNYPGVVFSPYQDSLANTIRCLGASNC